MTITVTLLCRHEDGFSDHHDLTGTRSVVVTREHVMLDSVIVVWRDRRTKKNRTAGHPWLSSLTKAWTGFSVRVEP